MVRRNQRASFGLLRGAVLTLVSLCLAACGAQWSLRTVRPEVAPRWPPPPARAKLTYLESLTGLKARRGPGSLLGAVLVGGESADGNAFLLPVAVATGHDGRLAVADLGRRCVHLFLPGSQGYLRLTAAEEGAIISPVGLAFDDDANLWVSDSAGRVLVFAPDGKLRFTLDQAGDKALQRPTGIAYSPTRKLLYVVDTLANHIHAFTTSGKLAFTFGASGDGAGQFNHPTHIFRSPAGELYVTDSLNFRVAIFDEGGVASGSFGHHGDGSGDLALPKGLAVDRDGVVYVVDGIFDNVQLFNRKGDFLLPLGRRGTDFGEFWLPAGAFIDESNDLYVCDTYNRRVQVFRISLGYAE